MKRIISEDISALIELARTEDLGAGDISTQLLEGASSDARFSLIAKEPCTLAGCEIAPAVLAAYDQSLSIQWCEGIHDGSCVDASANPLANLTGPLGALLTAERVLLNFLQRLCGIASLTRRYVDAVRGTSARILDTRKTLPGWRTLDKYAVRCGGGCNHRMGLYDSILLKDNHLLDVPTSDLARHVQELLGRVDRKGVQLIVAMAEADTVEQVEALLAVEELSVILLDNFSLADMCRAVTLRDNAGRRAAVELEASGGITLDTVRDVAQTGVDRISVGAITHSAKAIDLSMERC